jgi:putative hemolysin
LSDGELVQYISIGVLLLFSAYFSGTETAFFSLSRLERESLQNRKGKFLGSILRFLLSQQDQILITILCGNMIVNIFASSIGEVIGDRIFEGHSKILSIAAMTLLLLLFGELTPKSIAVRHPREISQFSSIPLFYVHKILTPIRFVFRRISGAIISLFPGETVDGMEARGHLVLSTVQLGHKQEVLDNSEFHLFRSHFALNEKFARHVMIPRSELDGVPMSISVEEMLRMADAGELPLYDTFLLIHRGDMDHLVGYVRTGDLIAVKYGVAEITAPADLIHDFHKVPETKDLRSLKTEMEYEDCEVALIVDQYGGTAGIVPFERIIENAMEVFFPRSDIEIIETQPGRFLMPGTTPIDRLNDTLESNVKTECRTVGGLFLELCGEIPLPGTRATVQELKLAVREADRTRVLSVEVEKEIVDDLSD